MCYEADGTSTDKVARRLQSRPGRSGCSPPLSQTLERTQITEGISVFPGRSRSPRDCPKPMHEGETGGVVSCGAERLCRSYLGMHARLDPDCPPARLHARQRIWKGLRLPTWKVRRRWLARRRA